MASQDSSLRIAAVQSNFCSPIIKIILTCSGTFTIVVSKRVDNFTTFLYDLDGLISSGFSPGESTENTLSYEEI